MQLESHDLNSLRKLVRNLQDENERLKALLRNNNVQYLFYGTISFCVLTESIAGSVYKDKLVILFDTFCHFLQEKFMVPSYNPEQHTILCLPFSFPTFNVFSL